MNWRARAAVIAALLALSGCGQEARTALPTPAEMTEDTVAHYCGMGVAEMPGPKGQIFVSGRKEPYWFASVRDTFAFSKLPEEPRNITAIFVNDMAKVSNWDRPEAGTWIEARRAWFVIGSSRRGGMSEQEAVPFGEEAKAKEFAAAYGGRIVRFDEMPDDYIFSNASALPVNANQDKQKD